MPGDFHARKSAKSKIYQYRIHNGPVVSPFDFRYVLHWPGRLDADGMARAASLFLAHHPRYAVFSVRFDAVIVSGLWPRHLPDVWQAPE